MVTIVVNGEKVNAQEVKPSSGVTRIAIPAPGQKQISQVMLKKTLADLPGTTKQMNIVSAVCLYKMFGLSNDDIALALGVESYMIDNVVVSSAYNSMYETVIRNILDEDADEVRQIFASGAKKAARSILELSADEDKAIKLRASQDLLDRAGHRPQDVVLHKHELENTMRIEYVDESQQKIPTVLNGEIDGKDL